MTRRAVFLDRDGVINRAVVRHGKPFPPVSVEELEILPGVPAALSRLRAAGYHTVVVTNQPDIARGTTTVAADAIHAQMRAVLGLDDIRVCPHDDRDGCDCRKPRPELLLRPPAFDMAASVMIGDRWRDIDAGRAAGCGVTILVDYHYDELVPHEPTVRVGSLAEAAEQEQDTRVGTVKMTEKRCKHCAAWFPLTRSDRVFCGQECAMAWHYERRKAAENDAAAYDPGDGKGEK